MAVNFNVVKELGDNRFLFRHTEQGFLHLIIEYKTSHASPFKLIFKKDTDPATDTMPWGSYILQETTQGNHYQFVYELTDPQTQQKEQALLEKALASQNMTDIKQCRLFRAYENIFSETSPLQKQRSLIFADSDVQRIQIQKLGKTAAITLKYQWEDHIFYADRMETTIVSHHEKKIDLGVIHDRRARIINIEGREITLLIRTGDWREAYWDKKTPPPTLAPAQLAWKTLKKEIKSHFVRLYHGDIASFWGLPHHVHTAWTFQQLGWTEPPFDHYIETALRLTHPHNYFFEKDPRYTNYFHQYKMGLLSGEPLRQALQKRLDLAMAKPKDMWSTIDAVDCIHFCEIGDKELIKKMGDLFVEKVQINKNATAHYRKHSLLSTQEPLLSAHGMAVVALLTLRKTPLAAEHLQWFLSAHPISTQPFIRNEYDPSVLTHTAFALTKISGVNDTWRSSLAEAHERIISLLNKNWDKTPLQTYVEILALFKESKD